MLGQNLAYSMYAPLPNMTLNGSVGMGTMCKIFVTLFCKILCELPVSMRIETGWTNNVAVSRSVFSAGWPRMACRDR